jgi:hypothetical protein
MSDRIPVHVKSEHVAAVYALVAQLEGHPLPPAAPVEQTGVVKLPPGTPPIPGITWSPGQLVQMFNDSPSDMKRLLHFLSENVGLAFSGPQLAALLGKKHGASSIAGMMGCLMKRSQNRYRMKTTPFRSYWSKARGQHEYSMLEQHAQHIRNLSFPMPSWWDDRFTRVGVLNPVAA